MARRERLFGALIDHRSISVIEYRHRAQGIEIVKQTESPVAAEGFDAAAETLGALLEAAGAGKSCVAVVVRGYDSIYEILTLPPGDKTVLRPVIEREMARLHPEVLDPTVGFAFGGQLERRQELRAEPGIPQREFVSAIMPRRSVSVLGEVLADRQIRIQHLTIAPQALARLVDEVDGSRDPTAAIVMLPGGPLIGFFQDAKLRLIAEPPLDPESTPTIALQVVIDHVERGRTYLRHKFRGADVTRVLLAADDEQRDHFAEVLNQALGIGVFPLGDALGHPAAALALGGILDSSSGDGLNLYPTEAETKTEGVKRRKATAVWAAALVCTLVVLWAGFGVLSAMRNGGKLKEMRARADQALASTAAVRTVVQERQANAQRLASLQELRAENLQLQQHLAGIGQAAPVNVELATLTLTRASAGWSGTLAGTAYGYSNVQSLRALSQFNMELPAALPLDELKLDSFEYAGDSLGGVPIKFGISFAVRGGSADPATVVNVLRPAPAPTPPAQ